MSLHKVTAWHIPICKSLNGNLTDNVKPLRQISIWSYIRRTQIFNLLFRSKLCTFQSSKTQYLILKYPYITYKKDNHTNSTFILLHN
jgi:hypothetical protein